MIEKSSFLREEHLFFCSPHFTLELISQRDWDKFFETIGPLDYAKHEEIKARLREDMWNELNDEQHITFSIRNADSDEFMGYCQYKLILTDFIDIGIELLPKHRGQGLGYQVCQALVNEFFTRSGNSVLYYKVKRENTASLCLIQKLGGTLYNEKYSVWRLYNRVEQLEEKSHDDLLENGKRLAAAAHAGFEREMALLEAEGVEKDQLTFAINRPE